MPTEAKMMKVKPRSAGGVFPDGKPVLPTVHYEGSLKRVIPPAGDMVPITSYYLRKIHHGDLEVISRIPASVKPDAGKAE